MLSHLLKNLSHVYRIFIRYISCLACDKFSKIIMDSAKYKSFWQKLIYINIAFK